MDTAHPWLPDGAEDILGQDRQIVSMLRALELLPLGGIVGVVGSNGGGRELFLQRAAWMLDEGRALLKLRNANVLIPTPVWYDPSLISPIGHPLAGVVNAIMRAGSSQGSISNGTELLNKLNRLNESSSPGTMRAGVMPAMERISVELANLLNAVRANRVGRLVILITGLERMTPVRRWSLLTGLRLFAHADSSVNIIISLDWAGARVAARTFEPNASEARLDELVDTQFKLLVQIQRLGLRRISMLLRRYLSDAEPLFRSSFGQESLSRLSLAVAHEPLGTPQFLQRLAARTILLAEFVQELRAVQDLTEAQWAWVVISQRWPSLRDYMRTTARWAELRQTLQWLLQNNHDPRDMVRSSLVSTLEQDPQLFRYLRQYAEGFRSDSDGLLRAEALLQDAGL